MPELSRGILAPGVGQRIDGTGGSLIRPSTYTHSLAPLPPTASAPFAGPLADTTVMAILFIGEIGS
jgi:hypothetical protein